MPGWMWIAIGGALGALARYGTGEGIKTLIDPAQFAPYGTWAANLLGCLLIGFLFPLLQDVGTEKIRLFAITGFLGAYTTFSTFSLESIQLLERQAYGWFFANAVGSVLLGLGFVILGMWLASFWVGLKFSA